MNIERYIAVISIDIAAFFVLILSSNYSLFKGGRQKYTLTFMDIMLKVFLIKHILIKVVLVKRIIRGRNNYVYRKRT